MAPGFTPSLALVAQVTLFCVVTVAQPPRIAAAPDPNWFAVVVVILPVAGRAKFAVAAALRVMAPRASALPALVLPPAFTEMAAAPPLKVVPLKDCSVAFALD